MVRPRKEKNTLRLVFQINKFWIARKHRCHNNRLLKGIKWSDWLTLHLSCRKSSQTIKSSSNNIEVKITLATRETVGGCWSGLKCTYLICERWENRFQRNWTRHLFKYLQYLQGPGVTQEVNIVVTFQIIATSLNVLEFNVINVSLYSRTILCIERISKSGGTTVFQCFRDLA